jgi:hypothetical protein
MTPLRAIPFREKSLPYVVTGTALAFALIVLVARAQSTKPAPARDWPPMVSFVGEGGRAFGSTWSLAQVPRVGETVKLAGLEWEVREVTWAFDSSDEGATLLQGDCTVKVRRKTR